MRLQISKDVELPIDAVTERVAFVGQSGSGKTYAAMRLAELMLEAGAQIISLDPMGIWWGLLSAANGEASGYPVNVFGGEHGHVAIVPEAGALVAEVVVSKCVSAVIDISHFTTSDQVMFSSAFAERFFELQVKVKRPVHLFLEEAHTFLPQNLPAEGRGGDPRRNPAVMLNRMERLVRQGRSQGIGCSMITQQPQAVNKKALNQAGTLFAMRTMGKHERKAIADWMADKATDEAQLKLDHLLPKLDTGHAWVASPHFLDLFAHTKVSKKKTYDSSATPKFGVRLETPKVLAEVDVEALRDAMKTVVDQVEKDDPAPLRRRIAGLEQQLRVAQAALPTKAFTAALGKLELQVAKALQDVHESLDIIRRAVPLSTLELRKLAGDPTALPGATPDNPAPWTPGKPMPNARYVTPTHTVEVRNVVVGASVGALPRAEPDRTGIKLAARDMLRELAAAHPRALTRRELATRCILKANTGNFRNYLSSLRSRGLVADSDGGDVIATDAGLKAAGTARPKARDEIVALWGRRLKRASRTMLDELLTGRELTREQLAQSARVEPNTGNFRNYLSQLRSAGLIQQQGAAFVYSEALDR